MTLLGPGRDRFRESGLTMRLMRYTTGVAMAALMAGTTIGQSAAQTPPARPASAQPAPAAGTLISAADDAS